MIIDAREPKKIRFDIEEELGEPIQEEYLKYGDFRWDSPYGAVAVERKAVSDLLNSIKTGRIATQLRGLLSEAAIPILLIEGKIGERWNGSVDIGQWKGSNGWTSQWNFSAVDHALLAWQMAGIFLAHSPTQSKTGHRIVTLYRWTQRPEHLSLGRRKVLTIKEDSPVVTTLSTFPGIGHKRSREIAGDHSIAELSGYTRKELEKLIGKSVGGKVYEHLHTILRG